LKAPAPPPSAEIPDWVPAAVRSYMLQTEQLFAGMPDLAIMHRLATDSRMRNVWRLLEKRAASDGALVEFFACAFQRTRLPYFVTTPKDRAALAAPWSSAARLCRWTKEHDIAAQMNPALAAAADMLARHFDEFARKEGRLDSPMVVGHHGKDDSARAYVRVLGDTTKRLFGGVLFGTVATTATVALQRPVRWQQVRKWCDTPS
jgi:hypothetical protein